MSYKLLTSALAAFLLFTLVSCDKSGGAINHPYGFADYIIHNQTSGELTVKFVTSLELGLETIDTIPNIQSGIAVKVFNDGIIGTNPRPTNSFSEINFILDNDEDVTYAISPIEDDQWIILNQDIDDTGYGLTQYELIITDDDF
jgi:hypothetical protein